MYPPCNRRRASRAVRRAVDLFLAAVGLILALPLLLPIAVAIKLDSPGPIVLRQQRIGIRRQPFILYKFRTMRADASGPSWTLPRDPRITRVGKVLRATYLDEVPQLLNVLRGEMAIVGPRPIIASEAEFLLPQHAARFAVPPGITGWAQVTYRYPVAPDEHREKFRLDAWYARHRSLWIDLQILLLTMALPLRRWYPHLLLRTPSRRRRWRRAGP